jgi:hypothetical protein
MSPQTESNVIDLDERLFKNLKTIHNNQVAAAIDSIKKNLNNTSIHVLKPFGVDLCCSPEFLCTLTQPELLDIWDSINAEIQFRMEERQC